MSKPQVTITLGRSGQKVVKRPRGTSDGGARANSHQPISGSKRSMRDRLDSRNADANMPSINKRVRGNASTRTPGSNAVEGVGPNDLRLKLTRKRLSRRRQHEVEERKKMELRQNMSRTIRSPEAPERDNLRQIPPKRRTDGLLMRDPLRSYTSWASEGNPESSDRGQMTSLPVNIDELRMMSSVRPIDASRTGSEPSRSNRPTTITMRGAFDANRPVSELLPASGGASRSSYMGEPPQTVTSLLLSLGLGKYAVQFQAEEVDMTVLKQMGDNDLKELGIPMGPRKKILLAVLPPPKKRQFVATTY